MSPNDAPDNVIETEATIDPVVIDPAPTLGKQLDDLLRCEVAEERIQVVLEKIRQASTKLITDGKLEVFLLSEDADPSSPEYLAAVQEFFRRGENKASVTPEIVRILIEAGIGIEIPMDRFPEPITDLPVRLQAIQRRLREHTRLDIRGINPNNKKAGNRPGIISPHRIAKHTISIVFFVPILKNPGNSDALSEEEIAAIQSLNPSEVRKQLNLLSTLASKDTPDAP